MEETENWKIGSDKETVTDLSARGALEVKLLKCPLKTGLILGYSRNIVFILGVSPALSFGRGGRRRGSLHAVQALQNNRF
jgi:hypothetical protein